MRRLIFSVLQEKFVVKTSSWYHDDDAADELFLWYGWPTFPLHHIIH